MLLNSLTEPRYLSLVCYHYFLAMSSLTLCHSSTTQSSAALVDTSQATVSSVVVLDSLGVWTSSLLVAPITFIRFFPSSYFLSDVKLSYVMLCFVLFCLVLSYVLLCSGPLCRPKSLSSSLKSLLTSSLRSHCHLPAALPRQSSAARPQRP